mmetsp:Transcript_123100/g.298927  ORF Transcript_123100/g.298927 Transcript_123100/m.298927 type:complete len:615 (+) Transcript_123100:41-1885(+)
MPSFNDALVKTSGAGGRGPLRALAAAALLAFTAAAAPSEATANPHAIKPGIWTWACGGAAYEGSHHVGHYSAICDEEVHVSRPAVLQGAFQVFEWAQLEPADGVFDWTWLDDNLTTMADAGVQANPAIWIHRGGSIHGYKPTPDWLLKESPGVEYRHSPDDKSVFVAPNYLDPVFQQKFTRLIQKVAAHLATLPKRVTDNIWGVHSAMGITGDSRPWKGRPLNSSQIISGPEWVQYCRKFAGIYVDAFLPTGIPVVANLENPAYEQADSGWFLNMALKKGMVGAGIKQGIPTHGYALNGEQDLYDSEAVPLLHTPLSDGSYAPARGELALEPDPMPGTYGNWVESPWWSLQANAEWVLTYGVSAWNLYAGFISNSTFEDTLTFFNRHAGHMDPSTSPAAFISFRDSLNTEDTSRWPQSKYGKVSDAPFPDGPANTKRMESIVADFKDFGARLEDATQAASPHSVIQKKGNYLNDVCWKCFSGNYGRFIEQAHPISTSVGWWRLGPKTQGYGRFARGLHHASGRTTITLQLHKDFSLSNGTARVVYYDAGHGQWSLSYNGNVMGTISKHGDEEWKVAKVPIGKIAAGEIKLSSPDGKDTAFSLLEVLDGDMAADA